jgi:hypothetical protein
MKHNHTRPRGRVRRLLRVMPAALFFCFAWPSLEAQDLDVFAHPLAAGALPRYTAICAELAARPLVKGSFALTKTLPRLNRSLVSRGDFIIAAEQGMVWETRSPFPSTLIVGRDFMAQSTPGGTKSKIDARGNELFMSIADTMSALFTGNAEKLREGFDQYFMETAGGTGWTVGLVPRERTVRSFMERIVLSGSASDGGGGALIRSIVIYEPGGGSAAYALSDHRFPAALDAGEAALFSID